MSFSGKVKEELAGQFSPARHCQVAEMAALLCGCGHVEKLPDGNTRLWIQTENEAVARKSFTLLRKTFNIETAIVIREGLPSETRQGVSRGGYGSCQSRTGSSGNEAFCG